MASGNRGRGRHLDDSLQVGEFGDVIPLSGPRHGALRRGQQAVLRQLSRQPGLRLGVLAQRKQRP